MANRFINRSAEGKVYVNALQMNIVAEEILQECKNRTELEKVASKMAEALYFVAVDKLKDLGDDEPYDFEVTAG